MVLWNLTKDVSICFKPDTLGIFFLVVTIILWVMNLIFSVEYMKDAKHKVRYNVFYCLTLLSMIGICVAGNLITMYMCYELMAIFAVPLVVHNQTEEAIAAAKKFLYYSMGGAFLGLSGFFVMYNYGDSLDFIPGGTLNIGKIAGHEQLILVITLLVIIGFGSKAGLFPLHAWLPTAHPVAPSPASAYLSGNITKMGVFVIIRFIFYQIGVDFVRGTWVQYAFMGLAMFTIVMGSMLAYKEVVFKKRLAYSTVSQVSYILLGIATLNPIGFMGALLHVVFHSFVKNTLFQVAGAIIHKTGLTNVSDYKDIARKMPITMWCFTLVSLTLVGVPPTSAFVSKWYLAQGSLSTGIKCLAWLGALALIISALLTAGYLLSITIKAFFPGEEYYSQEVKKINPNLYMLIPMILMTIVAVVLGIYPAPVMTLINKIVSSLFQ